MVIIKIPKKHFLLPLFLLLFVYMLFSTYNSVKRKTIDEFNTQQMLFAQQAAKSIESLFNHYLRDLTFLAGMDSLIAMNDHGKALMQAYHDTNSSLISGMSRVDARGRILYTVPYDPKAIGGDISLQDHVRRVIQTRRPVVSDVFTTLQGYDAIAYHVPVFRDTIFTGSLAVLIPFDHIAEAYIKNIRIGKTGYAWLISEKGIELYCPVPGHIGRNIYETSAEFASIIAMVREMTKGRQGTRTYTYDHVAEKKVRTITKHAAFHPIQLGNTIWSVVVATPEDAVLSTMTGFRNRLFFIVAILMVVGAIYFYFLVRAWAVLGEEKKRRQAEIALQESEKKYRDLVELGNSIILRWDSHGDIIYMNSYGLDFFGHHLDELVGRNVLGTIVPETESTTRRNLDVLMKEIQRDPDKFKNNENENMTKNGTRVWVSWSNKAIFNAGDELVEILSIGNDITEIKKLEAKLQQAQKMEAIGTLAGGVAHDLNNILSGIVSYPELLLLELPEDSKLRRPILTIQDSGHKAATIVQDLLTLARRGIAVTEVTNLNHVLSDYLSSPEHANLMSYHANVRFRTRLEPGLLNIQCSPVHLSKAVMNLVSNAAESMPNGGAALIETDNRYVDTPVQGYEDVEEGDYAILKITDTGIGLSSEDIPKIFEPFYTKKVLGRSGTGLGMSVVWGTVKDHHGYISVESTPKKGTAFTLYFPATRKAMKSDQPQFSIDQYQGNGEHILVIDDVERQREIASEILNKLGYRVTSVASGEAAVDYLREHTADLLVLDMIMDPGIDGQETYRRILELHPGQRAIIASGFSETDRVKEAQRLGAGCYIKKPYTLESLGLAIKNELEGDGSH